MSRRPALEGAATDGVERRSIARISTTIVAGPEQAQRARRAGGARRLPGRRLAGRPAAARPRARPGSVWFGERLIDGVLFPVLALRPRLRGAHRASRASIQPAVFRLAIPILLSLVVIRLIVRVLSRAFPRVAAGSAPSSAASRGWPGSRSVLWVTGVLPMMLDEMDEVQLEDRRDAGHACATSSRARSPRASCSCSRCGSRRRSRAQAARERSGHDLSLRKIAANAPARAAAVRRPDVRAVGGRHRPHGAVGARRRARRRPRLRPAEDRRQLRQRLRHPRRAQPAHRRHGQGRQLRGPHHRHPHPLHGDPLAQRARGDRAERDADHAPGSRTRRSPTRACWCRRPCRWPTAPTCAALQPLLEAAARRRAARHRRAGAERAARGLRGRRHGAGRSTSGSRDPENGQGNVKSDVNLAVLDVLRAEGVVFPSGQQTVFALVSKDAGATIAEQIDPATPPIPAASSASDPAAS